jgi:hypothetical protein
MSLLRSSRARCLPCFLGGALVCLLVTGALAAGQRGRPIEFSAPARAATAAKAHPALAKKPQDEWLQQNLQADLLDSLGLFGNRGSLSGTSTEVLRPPTTPPAQNERVKELLERRKNWALMTPEDLKNEPTLEELLNVQQYDRDGQKVKKQSPVERFVERQEREKLGNVGRRTDALAENRDGSTDEFLSPSANIVQPGSPFGQTESRLRNLFGVEPASALSHRGGSDGFLPGFSGSVEPAFPGRTTPQKARLEEFKQLLEPRLPVAPPSASANPLHSQLGPASPPSVLNTQPHQVVRPLFGTGDAVAGASSGAFPGVNAGAAGASSFTPALPAEPPRVAPPVLTIPKRKF